jgi:hypothetical protein
MPHSIEITPGVPAYAARVSSDDLVGGADLPREV